MCSQPKTRTVLALSLGLLLSVATFSAVAQAPKETRSSTGMRTFTLANGQQIPRADSRGVDGRADSQGGVTYADGTYVGVNDNGNTVVKRPDGTTRETTSSGHPVVNGIAMPIESTSSQGEATYTLSNGQQVPRVSPDGEVGVIDNKGGITYGSGRNAMYITTDSKGRTVASRNGEVVSVTTAPNPAGTGSTGGMADKYAGQRDNKPSDKDKAASGQLTQNQGLLSRGYTTSGSDDGFSDKDKSLAGQPSQNQGLLSHGYTTPAPAGGLPDKDKSIPGQLTPNQGLLSRGHTTSGSDYGFADKDKSMLAKPAQNQGLTSNGRTTSGMGGAMGGLYGKPGGSGKSSGYKPSAAYMTKPKPAGSKPASSKTSSKPSASSSSGKTSRTKTSSSTGKGKTSNISGSKGQTDTGGQKTAKYEQPSKGKESHGKGGDKAMGSHSGTYAGMSSTQKAIVDAMVGRTTGQGRKPENNKPKDCGKQPNNGGRVTQPGRGFGQGDCMPASMNRIKAPEQHKRASASIVQPNATKTTNQDRVTQPSRSLPNAAYLLGRNYEQILLNKDQVTNPGDK
jgi:hypothetical protein